MSSPPNTPPPPALDIQCPECGAIAGWFCEDEQLGDFLHYSRITAASKLAVPEASPA